MLGLGLGVGLLMAGGLIEGVRDGVGVPIDGLDRLGENDLLRSNDGLDGIVGVDRGLIDGLGVLGLNDGLGRLGLMEGLDLPGLMDGLGVIERLGLGEPDPRLLLMRSNNAPRSELPACAMIDGLRRLGIDKPLR